MKDELARLEAGTADDIDMTIVRVVDSHSRRNFSEVQIAQAVRLLNELRTARADLARLRQIEAAAMRCKASQVPLGDLLGDRPDVDIDAALGEHARLEAQLYALLPPVGQGAETGTEAR